MVVKRETNKLLKCLRSDNSGEYSFIGFDDYCSKYDIRYKKKVPYSLQLNRVMESMNKTLMERMWCMLSLAKFPKRFWVKP